MSKPAASPVISEAGYPCQALSILGFDQVWSHGRLHLVTLRVEVLAQIPTCEWPWLGSLVGS